MNRICPSIETLSEYISGLIPQEYLPEIEEHFANCSKCRELLAEVHEALAKPTIPLLCRNVLSWIRKNLWLIGGCAAFFCSFLFAKYFLQFLAACLIMCLKWLIDAKTVKTLIMVYEAWKQGKTKKGEEKHDYKTEC